ncbi:MAG: hypothetical protein MZV63_61285 [Marinilabiliales bacterium]|nr:hypothetical protein [Marinilabiliales bacterium]
MISILPSTLGEGKILAGFSSLAPLMINSKTVIIDGYNGVFWDQLSRQVIDAISGSGIRVRCIFTIDFMKSEKEIEEMTSPYSGGSDPLFGTRCGLPLSSFFRMKELTAFRP